MRASRGLGAGEGDLAALGGLRLGVAVAGLEVDGATAAASSLVEYSWLESSLSGSDST